jgi:outer membrane protein OmpA-like peptidoglycan-associated protein
MRDNPDLRIEIQGHVCCTYDGADGPNMETGGQYLSVDRAKAVYDYLVYYGISETRLNYKGFGGSKRLVDPELTEGDRTRNRRVEIVVLKD